MRRTLARAVASSVVVILSITTTPMTFAQSQQPASNQQTSPSGPEQQPSRSPDATPQSGHQPPIELPENPGRSNTPQSTTPAPTQPATQPEPNGTAVAPPIETAGGAASKPAGVAIAPPKQRQIHSLLIKLGFLAGAGIALGTVVGLSAASPSRVPNSPTPSGPGR